MPDPQTNAPDNTKMYLIVGMIAGFSLILTGIGFLFLSCIIPFYLTLCIGLGLVAGALGTTATVKFKGHVMTGSGAVGLVLFFAIQNSNMEKVTFGMITGPFSTETQIIMTDFEEILGAMRDRGQSRKAFHFVIKGEKLLSTHLSIDINGKTLAVDRKFIDPVLRKDKPIEWSFDSTKNILLDNLSKTTIGHLQLTIYSPPQTSKLEQAAAATMEYIFGYCYAAGTLDISSPEFSQYISGLGSDNLRVNKESIQVLSQQDFSILPVLMTSYMDSLSTESLRTNIIKVLALLYQKSQKDFLSKLDDKEVIALVRTSKNKSGVDALYAQMLIDTITKVPANMPRMAKLKNQVKNKQEYEEVVWKISNFAGNIWYFKLGSNHSVLYGKDPVAITQNSEPWQWKVQDTLLTIGWTKEFFTINLRSNQNNRYTAIVRKNGVNKTTWAQQVIQ